MIPRQLAHRKNRTRSRDTDLPGHGEDLSDRLRARGFHLTATDLRRLPYEVHLSDRLRTRLQR